MNVPNYTPAPSRMKPAPVLTKNNFVARYQAGEFGNRAPTWNTFTEYWQSGYEGPVHFRNRVTGGETWYNVPRYAAEAQYQTYIQMGLKPDDLYFSAMAPHSRNLLQGEVQRSTEHLTLFYSRARDLPMRAALAKDGKQAIGILALSILNSTLCVNSYTWLQHLLEAYDDHVIEFSTFEVCWGTMPGYNTVFWEVRRY